MADDPMYKLEHGIKDQKKAKEDQPRLTQIEVIDACMAVLDIVHVQYPYQWTGCNRTCNWRKGMTLQSISCLGRSSE